MIVRHTGAVMKLRRLYEKIEDFIDRRDYRDRGIIRFRVSVPVISRQEVDILEREVIMQALIER